MLVCHFLGCAVLFLIREGDIRVRMGLLGPLPTGVVELKTRWPEINARREVLAHREIKILKRGACSLAHGDRTACRATGVAGEHPLFGKPATVPAFVNRPVSSEHAPL